VNQIEQARAGISAMIKANPSIITISRIARVTDGFGGTMEDPLGETMDYKFRVMLSHEKSSIQHNEDSSVGTSTNMVHMMTMDYRGGPLEGEEFSITDAVSNSLVIGATYSTTPITYSLEHVASIESMAHPVRKYRVGRVDPLLIGGKIAGYQAALFQVDA
jgi:hypothetical protein